MCRNYFAELVYLKNKVNIPNCIWDIILKYSSMVPLETISKFKSWLIENIEHDKSNGIMTRYKQTEEEKHVLQFLINIQNSPYNVLNITRIYVNATKQTVQTKSKELGEDYVLYWSHLGWKIETNIDSIWKYKQLIPINMLNWQFIHKYKLVYTHDSNCKTEIYVFLPHKISIYATEREFLEMNNIKLGQSNNCSEEQYYWFE